MLWDEASTKSSRLAERFLFGTALERSKNYRTYLGLDVPLGPDVEPFDLIFGLLPRPNSPSNAPECRVLVLYHRSPGHPHKLQIERGLRAHLATEGITAKDLVVQKFRKPFFAQVLPNPGSAGPLRGSCPVPFPGVQIGANGLTGAICCFAKVDGESQRYAVTVAHALGADGASHGTIVHQPEHSHPASYVLGQITKVRPQPAGARHPIDVAAIAVSVLNVATNLIHGTRNSLTMKLPSSPPRDVAVGDEVANDGPGNGLQLGRVCAVNVRARLPLPHGSGVTAIVVESGILVSGTPGAFSAPGDSGCPVFDPSSGELLGMVVGGQSSADQVGDSIYLPIAAVLDAIAMNADV